MIRSQLHFLRCIVVMVAAILCFTSTALTAQREPVDYVDPYIGSVGHLLRATRPYVQLPHCMIQAAPVMTPGVKDTYLTDRIFGFPAGASMITPVSGDISTDAAENASLYDHDFETATPYRYDVLLEDYDIEAAYSVTERCIIYRFTFPPGKPGSIVFSLVDNAEVSARESKTVTGAEMKGGVRYYFYASFDRPYDSTATWTGSDLIDASARAAGDGIGMACRYTSAEKNRVEVRIGISLIGYDQARTNFENELAGRSFEEIVSHGRKTWNDELGRIAVEGGTEEERTIFYTALYRAMTRMRNIAEYGRYYSGYDGAVHDTKGSDFYIDDWLWDTYRCMHPLQLLLDPARKLDMIRSYVRMYEQSGWLPLFPGEGGDRPVMIGHHATAMITDAWMKGLRDFDVETAYEAMKKNAMEATMLPWRVGPMTDLGKVYLDKGFFPALPYGGVEWVDEVHDFERRQAVAVTLEHAYDDWCLAVMAKDMGKDDDYDYFTRRARNYENVYNAETGFMSPRTADGAWVEPFDPKLSGGQGGRDYFAECNSWVYTWHVQHDVAGLINLMGGRDTFVTRLDQLFVEQPSIAHFHFLGQFPDSSGLIGLYPQGDEPSFHIPFLYNYAGAPWKTQRRLRRIMDVWYDDDPLGISGDEDGGAMSSWYVFAAMGFYPVCPGRPVYDIGSPVFEKIVISPKGGRPFTIEARNASAQNKYIQSASLDGVPLKGPWFTHEAVARGGTLLLEMGPRPNKAWGADPGDAPPSMSDEHIDGR